MVRKRSKLEIFGIALIVLVFMVASFYTLYRTEAKNKPIVKEKISSKDFNYLYDFYISSIPNINERPFFGSDKAAIYFIAYLDITSEASQYFISEIFPELKREYIDKGIVKFYAKNHITIQDFEDKNEKFIYAQTLLCVSSLNQESYYPFYFDLFRLGEKDINALLTKYNISIIKYNKCMDEEKFDELKEDISETENFGLRGINGRFYIGITGINYKALNGVPKYVKFNRTIRDYELVIGN